MELKEFFELNKKAALAFSGGVDSSYLLYAGLKYGADIKPYYVKSQFQPEFEFHDAERLAAGLGADMTVIRADILACRQVRENPTDRCYYCKRTIMSKIISAAADDGYTVLLDGSNASDDSSDRPGMRAAGELHILSPLRECGLTKGDIRRLSKDAGLFTWSKPAYACLATRVKTGEELTNERLKNIEASEDYLFSRGYTDFRVRTSGSSALLQFTADQLGDAQAHERELFSALSVYFDDIKIDTNARTKSL